jgi:DNA-binding MarR family transcriptional regulator
MGVSDAKVSASSTAREQQVGEIAAALPQRAAELSKLFLTRTTISVSRTEIAVLRSLTRRPRRITELAYEESVTQPAITLLVNRLADRGWVRRVPDPTDGRAVLVSLSTAGREKLYRLIGAFGDGNEATRRPTA